MIPVDNQKEVISKITDTIEKHGCIFRRLKVSDDDLPITHTIGLTNQNMPELILIGPMVPLAAHGVMTRVIGRWFREGVSLGEQNGLLVNPRKKDLPVELVELDLNHPAVKKRVESLLSYYEATSPGKRVRLVQVRWPDENGQLPRDKQFSMHHMTNQLPELTMTMEA